MSDIGERLGDMRDTDEYPTEKICRNCNHHLISGAKRPRCPKCKRTAMLGHWETEYKRGHLVRIALTPQKQVRQFLARQSEKEK